MSLLDEAYLGGALSQLPPQITDNTQPVDKSPAMAAAGGTWSEFRAGYDGDLSVIGTTPAQTTDETTLPTVNKQVAGFGPYMSLLDGLFTLPGPASAIATSGEAVAIDPTPPVGANQVLVTTNPTHAHWAAETGGGGGGETTTFVANENLSALRVVRLVGTTEDQVRYARPPEVEAEAPLGITATSALSGESVTVIRSGSITDASWHWIPGLPVLCDINGGLTQVQPALPYIVAVGIASTAQTIQLKISPPIFLAA